MKIAFKRTIVLTYICALFIVNSNAQKASVQLPYLKTLENHTQLIVNGKPYLMVAGELHNSTSSTPEYFNSAMQNAKSMNINTVIASVAWEQFEPQEGKFDYSLIDFILKNANKHQLKVVLIWFATWKNGESSYTPLWVKNDSKRFFRIKNKDGENISAISPFCQEAMKADAKAFESLMKYLKKTDLNHTVVMVQPENEVGAFSEIDYNEVALKKYKEQVPRLLITYIQSNENQLENELKAAWIKNGKKLEGSWPEIFGENNFDAQNFFMSWHYASFINEVCKTGKNVLSIPMYVNAWLVQYPTETPGKYPNGGPVSRVMDIYKAAAPYIDFISPDIYLPNFKEVCSMYSKPAKNNPLFIPECERSNPGKAYYALAENNALGFGPFGIESLIADDAYALSFKILKDELLPLVSKYQGTNKMRGILKEGNENSQSLQFGKYNCFIEFMEKDKNAYGIIIQTSEDEFIVAGINLKISFFLNINSKKIYFGQVLEGGYKGQNWNTYRYLNGDETWHNSFLFVKGRSFIASHKGESKNFIQTLAPIPVLNQSLETNLEQRQISSPGIYKVKLSATY